MGCKIQRQREADIMMVDAVTAIVPGQQSEVRCSSFHSQARTEQNRWRWRWRDWTELNGTSE